METPAKFKAQSNERLRYNEAWALDYQQHMADGKELRSKYLAYDVGIRNRRGVAAEQKLIEYTCNSEKDRSQECECKPFQFKSLFVGCIFFRCAMMSFREYLIRDSFDG